jgi:O-antigen/teichoic acid export membrane protein
LLNRFSLILFGLAAYVLLARKVFPTAAEMGIWALFTSIIALIETIKQGLLRNPMIKFMSEPEYVNNRNRIQSASLLMNIFFSLLVVLFLAFGGAALVKWLNSPGLYALIPWGILLIILLIPFNHCEVLLQAHFRFQQIFYGYFLRQAVFLSGMIWLLVFDRSALSLVNLVRLQILGLVCGTILLIYQARSYFYRGFEVEKKTLWRIFHFGKYIFGTNVFSAFGRSADQFITAGLISPEVVAYYNVVSRINNLMDLPSMAVADVLFPKNVEAMASSGEEKVRYYFERTVGSILCVLVPASLLIFLLPRFFVGLIAGSRYYAAIPILQTVILFSFLRPFSYQFGATMDAIGRPAVNFRINLVGMCLNYGCMYAGLKIYGWMGAAYGAVVSAILVFFLMYIILRQTIGIRLGETFRYAGRSYREMFTALRKLLIVRR